MKTENKNNWYVCDRNGNLAGHDLNQAKAKDLESQMQDKEPDREWEALESNDN